MVVAVVVVVVVVVVAALVVLSFFVINRQREIGLNTRLLNRNRRGTEINADRAVG